MYVLVQIINGLQIGSVYALIALGYTMVYGIVKLINFAHGDLMMVSAYFMWLAVTSWGIPMLAAIPLVMAMTALVGFLIEKIAYRPLRGAPRLSALITAIGVSLFLQNLFMIIFSPDPQRFPTPDFGLPYFELSGVRISSLSLVTTGAAILIMVVLHLFVMKTRLGKAMRAVSEDTRAAQLMGINVDTTISMTFMIGSALAAFAGMIFIVQYPQITPYMGAMPGLKAFIAAVLGGIGILPGAMFGGFLLGIVESLSRAFLPSAYSQLSDAIVFAILIVVLLVKPAGLFGKVTRQKV